MENKTNNDLPAPIELEDSTEKVDQRKEFWLFAYIKNYAKEKPKQTFTIMFSLVVLSVVFSLANYFYVQNVTKPEYEKMKQRNFLIDATNSISQPLDRANDIMDMREAMKELEAFKHKEQLTRQDSIRIKYLIDKYQKR